MGDVDSAVAKQRIEDRGKDIDALSDYMDRLVDSKGKICKHDKLPGLVWKRIRVKRPKK